MYKLWLLDIAIGGVGSGASTYALEDGGGGIIDTFASIFTSGFEIITGNNALLAILCVAVGAPILGAVISIFRGR